MRTFLITFILALSLNAAAGCGGNAGATGTNNPTDTVLICKSKSARAYHGYECRGLKRCTYTLAKVTRAQAVKLGYRPCKICFPAQ